MLSDVILTTDTDIINEVLTVTFCRKNYMKDDVKTKYCFLVVTNSMRNHAAATIFCSAVQDRLLEIFPEGYYLLPSSVHEFLVVSKNMHTLESLRQIVHTVNNTDLLPEDYLAEDIYYFDKNGNFCMAK